MSAFSIVAGRYTLSSFRSLIPFQPVLRHRKGQSGGSGRYTARIPHQGDWTLDFSRTRRLSEERVLACVWMHLLLINVSTGANTCVFSPFHSGLVDWVYFRAVHVHVQIRHRKSRAINKI
jgi:hypothetical protein